MVNICVCGGCSNSSLTGHRVHRFPAPKKPVFRAWVRFVGLKRQHFTSSSVSTNSVICSAHFREEDYNESDLNEHRMGFRCKDKIRLKSDAAPSVHSRGTGSRKQDRPGAAVTTTTTTTTTMAATRLSGGSSRPAAPRKLEVARIIAKVMSQAKAAKLNPDTDKAADVIDDCVSGQKHQTTTVNDATRGGYRPLISYHSTVVPADVEQMVLIKEEAPEEWRPGVDQLDPEALNIKEEEEEEPWSRLEGEQLNVKEETDVSSFSIITVTLKSEDEEEPLLSQLHQHQVEDRDVPSSSSADGEDCGGAETSRNPDLQTHKDHSSSSETELSEDYDKEQDVEHQHNKKNRGIKTGETHRNVQTGEKTVSCDVCGRRFRHKGSLTKHIQIHTGDKMFTCIDCGKKFSRKSSLTSHTRVHTGDKPFPCGFCGQRFSQKSYKNAHMRIHTEDKPFPCEVCGHRFKRKSTLNSHVRIHTGDKPFPCHVCGQRFRQRGHLNTHIRIHPGEKCVAVKKKTAPLEPCEFTQN